MKNIIIVLLLAALALLGYFYLKNSKTNSKSAGEFSLISGRDSVQVTYYGITIAEDSIARVSGKQIAPHSLTIFSSNTTSCDDPNSYPPCFEYNVKPTQTQKPGIYNPPWIIYRIGIKLIPVPSQDTIRK